MKGEISIPKLPTSFQQKLDFQPGSPSSDITHNNRLKSKYMEADMSDSLFDFPLHKHSSTSSLQTSSFHKVEDTPSGLDITENSSSTEQDKFLTLDPHNLNNLRKWIVGFCIVKFDLEIGQALDYVYPPMDLTKEEQKNICFSAFPDSNVFEVGDQIFNIRVKACTSKFAVSGPTIDAGFLYGYVFFRQKKDSNIRRGYFQKSLVLLSQHPFVGLFSRIVTILGSAYFNTGQPMLEAACMNISQWTAPEEGQVLDLPFLGRLLQVELPSPFKPQLLETTPFDMNKLQPDIQIMASLPVGGLYNHFKDVLKDLWLLWELMLLAEPIVIIAPEPSVCSEAVISLVDIINPIPYCGDYRPYFTIQDSDFKSFVTKNKPLSSLVLGVTNPFFNTAVQHWPNIVRVGKHQLRKPDGTLVASSHLGKSKSTALLNVQGVTTKRKSVISRDRELIKMLTEASVRGYPPDWVLNNILRRQFVDLTEKFLVPLNRYFSTLIPVNIPLNGQIPRLKPFQSDQFMKSLKEHGPQLPFKSTFKTRTSTTDPTKELYSQFLKCGNFATWLQQRTAKAEEEILKMRHRKL